MNMKRNAAAPVGVNTQIRSGKMKPISCFFIVLTPCNVPVMLFRLAAPMDAQFDIGIEQVFARIRSHLVRHLIVFLTYLYNG